MVGEKGVSTCTGSSSIIGISSTSGLDGSSLMFTDSFSLKAEQQLGLETLTDGSLTGGGSVGAYFGSIHSLTTSSEAEVASSVMSEMIGPELRAESAEKGLAAA